jgi:cytidine deaminase
MDRETIERLVAHALEMMPRAYAPYSRFQVGAAVLAASGKVYGGANVENASYPAGICAERSAIAQAAASGERKLTAIAICGGKEGRIAGYCPPCGICRQTMREFCDPEAFRVVVARSAGDYKVYTLAQLLPDSFGPGALDR